MWRGGGDKRSEREEGRKNISTICSQQAASLSLRPRLWSHPYQTPPIQKPKPVYFSLPASHPPPHPHVPHLFLLTHVGSHFPPGPSLRLPRFFIVTRRMDGGSCRAASPAFITAFHEFHSETLNANHIFLL